MGDSRHKSKYPEGQMHQMTPEWKASVTAALKRLGRSQKWLADEIGADKSSITVMLRATSWTSHLVAAVSKALGIPMPTVGVDAEHAEALDLVRQLDADDTARAIDFLRRLVR